MILDKKQLNFSLLISSLSTYLDHIYSLSTVLTLSNYMHKGHLLATASECPLCFIWYIFIYICFYVISLQLNRLEIRFALNVLQDTYYL